MKPIRESLKKILEGGYGLPNTSVMGLERTKMWSDDSDWLRDPEKTPIFYRFNAELTRRMWHKLKSFTAVHRLSRASMNAIMDEVFASIPELGTLSEKEKESIKKLSWDVRPLHHTSLDQDYHNLVKRGFIKENTEKLTHETAAKKWIAFLKKNVGATPVKGDQFLIDTMEDLWGRRAGWTIKKNGIFSDDDGTVHTWQQEIDSLLEDNVDFLEEIAAGDYDENLE